MTSTSIPGSVEDITPAWLRDACVLDVEDLAVEQIGVGIGVSSALYRLHLTGERCPATVVAKLPALDPAAVFTSTVLRMYLREVRFFARLAADSPVRVPHCYHAAVEADASRFVVVMEDMGGLRHVDQILGMEPADAERAVDGLAAWHATWWRGADHLVDEGTSMSLGDPVYPAILPVVFAEGWAKVTSEMQVAPAIRRVGPGFGDVLGRLLEDLARPPTTLAHGDFRADNILFQPDGSIALLDFQLIGTGSGAYDLAYFTTQSLTPEAASGHERALFDRWLVRLQAAGVPDGDLERMWEDYRKAALFCLVYPIVASRGMDLSDPRQRDLIDCMNTRFARAIDELDLGALL